MIRFMIFCMAFIAISFAATPIFFGVSAEHKKLTQTAVVTGNTPTALTFEEIYALIDQDALTDPARLNAIEPAAGDDDAIEEKFSNGFSGKEDSALTDIIEGDLETELAL